jgi:rhamnogalacturonyl hydrolase YesR
MNKLKPDVLGWYKSGLSWQTRFWMDDMFMITALQGQAYLATGNTKYINWAANEMAAYLDKLQNQNGLFYHTPDAPFYWGRGNGWMAVGMTNLLKLLPSDNPNRQRIMEGYLKMMERLLQYQDNKGMWHQLIDDPNAWAETSCTGMFTYAFIVGVENGWLKAKTYGPAARKAWIQLVTYIMVCCCVIAKIKMMLLLEKQISFY